MNIHSNIIRAAHNKCNLSFHVNTVTNYQVICKQNAHTHVKCGK